jgi:Lipocalin-like domain
MRVMAKPTAWAILIVASVVLASGQTGAADDRQQVIGFWKLISYVVEIQATGQIEQVMGQHPTGYVNFSPEGRVMFILTGEGRKPAKTTEERADLLSTLVHTPAPIGLKATDGSPRSTLPGIRNGLAPNKPEASGSTASDCRC